MIHERSVIKPEHSETGLHTITAVKVTDNGVERETWEGEAWVAVQYAVDLMPPLLAGLTSPSLMPESFFGGVFGESDK